MPETLPSDPAQAGLSSAADEEQRQRFWMLLLLAALALFAVETFWANRKQEARV